MPFSKVKNELEALHEDNLVFEALEKSDIFSQQHAASLSSDDVIQLRLIISQIKEHQELIEKLHSLAYHTNQLRAAKLTQDSKKQDTTMKHIMTNDLSSIPAIVDNLNLFKSRIDKLDYFQHSIIGKRELNLETKTNLGEEFKQKHQQLTDIHSRHKQLFLSLSNHVLTILKNP